ncbi:MAG: hypothetical protein MUE98_05025 [Rhodobacteraceae bacterium]|jgi:hypothetical protein|nr:hypothetical protein [Paracoccaceae bacterium]
MSFRIYASGTGGFQYDRNGVDFGDVYEFADGLSRMYSVTGGASSFFRGEATSAVHDRVVGSTALQRALSAMGELVGANLLREMVTLLAVYRTPTTIGVHARRESLTWADATGFGEVTLRSDEREPAVAFFRAVSPALLAAEMNTFGVLAAMARVMSDFTSHPCHRGADGQYRLLIQLSA